MLGGYEKSLCKCYFMNEYGWYFSERFPMLIHLETGISNFHFLTQEGNRCRAVVGTNKIPNLRGADFPLALFDIISGGKSL